MKMDNSKSSLFWTSLFVVLLGVLISAIGIGAYFLRECPVQPYIPIYLIVFGIFALLSMAVSLCLICAIYSKDIYAFLAWIIVVIPVCFVLYLFDVCWFITGSVWIYSVYPPSYDPTNVQNYCNKTLYLFAFWLNTVFFGFLALILLAIVCSVVYTCAKTTKPPLASASPQLA